MRYPKEVSAPMPINPASEEITALETDDVPTDPAEEEKYWKKHFKELAYVDKRDDYEVFGVAFRTGYMGWEKHPKKTFQEVEDELRRDYEAACGDNPLSWEKAGCAVCDAWSRVNEARRRRPKKSG